MLWMRKHWFHKTLTSLYVVKGLCYPILKGVCINMVWQYVYSVTVDYIYQLSPPNQSASLVVSFTGLNTVWLEHGSLHRPLHWCWGWLCEDSIKTIWAALRFQVIYLTYPRYMSSIILHRKYNYLSSWCHEEVTILKLTAQRLISNTFLSAILISASYLRNSCPNNSTTMDHWTFFPNK